MTHFSFTLKTNANSVKMFPFFLFFVSSVSLDIRALFRKRNHVCSFLNVWRCLNQQGMKNTLCSIILSTLGFEGNVGKDRQSDVKVQSFW